MNKRTASMQHFSAHATLAALGLKTRSLHLFDPIERNVRIFQKSIKHQPIEKLKDAFIAILAGAHGLSEINTRLRSDSALQRAFGRERCAEQSIVQRTLDACTAENVTEMRFHDLRHEYGSRLGDADVNLKKITRLMGHSNTKQTERYVHPDDDGLLKATTVASTSEPARVLPGRLRKVK